MIQGTATRWVAMSARSSLGKLGPLLQRMSRWETQAALSLRRFMDWQQRAELYDPRIRAGSHV